MGLFGTSPARGPRLDTPPSCTVNARPRRKREKHVANIKSAEKQNRKMIKNRARNRAAMATLRTAVKKARTAVDSKADDAAALVKQAVSIVDSAVTKGILKRRTASRYVSRLATRSARCSWSSRRTSCFLPSSCQSSC